MRYHNNTGPDRAPNTTHVLRRSVPTHNALCRDAPQAGCGRSNTTTLRAAHRRSMRKLLTFTRDIGARVDAIQRQSPSACSADARRITSFGDMYNLPLGAWILILQRHNFLVSICVHDEVGKYLLPDAHAAGSQTRRRRSRGRPLFPDPSTTTLASVRRFLEAPRPCARRPET